MSKLGEGSEHPVQPFLHLACVSSPASAQPPLEYHVCLYSTATRKLGYKRAQATVSYFQHSIYMVLALYEFLVLYSWMLVVAGEHHNPI